MNKSEYTGWQAVFGFSLSQGLKETSYIAYLILMSIVTIVLVPVMTFITSGKENKTSEKVSHSYVSELTIYDEIGFDFDYSQAFKGVEFYDVVINSYPKQSFQEHVNQLQTDESEKSKREMIVRMYLEDGQIILSFVKSLHTVLSNQDCQYIANTMIHFVDHERGMIIDATENQLEILNTATRIEIENPNRKISYMTELVLLMILMTSVFGMIHLCSSKIAYSIIAEKNTRVVEYLLIRVKPMALILGKVLAGLLLAFIQMGVMLISMFLSLCLNSILFGMKEVQTDATYMETLGLSFSAGKFALAFGVMLAGVLLFCILSGLTGAMVNQISEAGDGLMICNLLLAIGMFLGLFACVLNMRQEGNHLFSYICCLLPISAPFIVPVKLITGSISYTTTIISLLILIVSIGLLFSFTSKVYESLIFYKGKNLTFRDVLEIAKEHKRT